MKSTLKNIQNFLDSFPHATRCPSCNKVGLKAISREDSTINGKPYATVRGVCTRCKTKVGWALPVDSFNQK